MLDTEDKAIIRYMAGKGKSIDAICRYTGYGEAEIRKVIKTTPPRPRFRDVGPAIGMEEMGERRTLAEDANHAFMAAVAQAHDRSGLQPSL